MLGCADADRRGGRSAPAGLACAVRPVPRYRTAARRLSPDRREASGLRLLARHIAHDIHGRGRSGVRVQPARCRRRMDRLERGGGSRHHAWLPAAEVAPVAAEVAEKAGLWPLSCPGVGEDRAAARWMTFTCLSP